MKEKARKARQSLGLAARVILAAVIITVIIWKYNYLVNLDVRTLITDDASLWAAGGTVLGVYFLKAVVFVVPAMLIYTSVGLIFKTWQAIVINAVGLLIEIIVTWALGRFLGGDYVTKKLSKSEKGKKLLKLDTTKYLVIFGVRALPVFPFDFASLFLGASNMPFLPYLLLSFFGILPRMILFTIIGDKIYDYIPMKYIIPAILAVVGIAMAVWIIRYIVKIKRSEGFKYVPVTESRRDIILDTDIGPDCDDAGALAVMIALLKEAELKPAGVVNCTSNPFSNGVIHSILAFTGSFSTPVAQTDRADFLADNSVYAKAVSEKFMGPGGGLTALNAVEFYTDFLSKANDDSVVLVTIGMLNNISDLLDSQPELVRKKVHALIAMAGEFPGGGREYNIHMDAAAAKNVFDNFPAPIICSGYEIGKKIITGYPKAPANADDNPVYECYRLYTSAGKKGAVRESWDLTTVQFAVEGCTDLYTVSEPVRITVGDDGTAAVVADKTSNRYYLKLRAKPNKVRDRLNAVLDGFSGGAQPDTEE